MCPHWRDFYYAHCIMDRVDVKYLDSKRVPKRKRRGGNGGVAGTGMKGEEAVRTLPEEFIPLVMAMWVDGNTGNRRRRRNGDRGN